VAKEKAKEIEAAKTATKEKTQTTQKESFQNRWPKEAEQEKDEKAKENVAKEGTKKVEEKAKKE